MSACILCDTSKGAADGYWCQATGGAVQDHDFCNTQYGYEKCPYCGNQDILTERLAREICEAVSRAVRDAAWQLYELFTYLWDVVARTNYLPLYQAVLNGEDQIHPRSYTTVNFNGLVSFKVERGTAWELQERILRLLDLLDASELPQGEAIYGGELDVSDDRLSLTAGVIRDYTGWICYPLRSFSIGRESKYAACAEKCMRETAYYLEWSLTSLIYRLDEGRDLFIRGTEALAAAGKEEGSTLSETKIRWKF